ncbi:MAG: hypothetical protein CL940_12205 [Deltaproteobacteria bacterium]|nr:hypothetical protein [Deltaproteobacteria bacterium]
MNPAGRLDHERELAPRGQRDSSYIGEWMAARDLLPDLVLVSSAARTQETFERWRAGAGWDGASETDDELYLASSYEICDRIAQLDNAVDRVLVIGHNPGLEMTVRELTDTAIVMKTATLACLTSELEAWSHAVGRGTCALVETHTPERS